MSPVVSLIRELPEGREEHGIGAGAVPCRLFGDVDQVQEGCARGACPMPFLVRISACRCGCWYRSEK